MGMTNIERRLLKGGASSVGSAAADLADLPVRVTREDAARLLTKYFFKTSPRTLERWPVTWRRVNGRAHVETTELFAVAEAMLAEAPSITGGRKGAP